MRFALLLVALLLLMPRASSAHTAGQDLLIKHYRGVLNRLPGVASDYSHIEPLVTKLAKLDPKKASVYWKTGLTKFADSPTAQADVYRLLYRVRKMVRRSGLPHHDVSLILKGLTFPLQSVPLPPGTYSL